MKKLAKLDVLIIIFLLISTLFFRYGKVLYTEWYYVDFVILLSIFFRSLTVKLEFNIKIFISFFLLLVVVLINFMSFGFGKVAVDNLLMHLSPLTIIFYLIYLKNRYDYSTLWGLTQKLTSLLNVYFILNSLIILIQTITQTFMMGRFLQYNPYAFDHMTGFIGMNGVGVLNFFWIGTILLNLYFYSEQKTRKRLFLIVIQVIIMFSLSVFNDNKMVFLTFTFFFGLFLYFKFVSSGLSFEKVSKVLRILLAGITVMIVLYFANQNIASEIERTFNLLNDFFFQSASSPDKHNERAYLNYLAFSNYNAAWIGIGLNKVNLLNQYIHVHLGINSSSLVMIQGGWIYLVAIINIYTLLIISLISERGKKGNNMTYLLIFLSILMVSYATQPFRDHYIIVMLALIYFSYFLCLKSVQD